MIEELSEEYVPKDILHREEQIRQIKEVYKNFRENKIGTNLILFGCTGSGKTTLLKKVISEEDSSIYISCDETQTCHKTLKSFFNTNQSTTQGILEVIIKKLKDNPKVIILDEIDKIARYDDFVKLMNALNTIYRKTAVPIIMVTLKRDILSEIKQDVRKTLLPERINLPSYNALELKDILKSRIESLKIDLNIDEGEISYISALASRQGSARILINLLIKCIQKNNFSHDFIDDAYCKVLKADLIDFINDINDTEKEFLRALFFLGCDYEKETTAGDITKSMGLNGYGFSGARISQLINTFENYGVVTSWHENLGKAGGRRRFVRFSSKEMYEELNNFMYPGVFKDE
jgi:cell division control protein 6